MADDLPRILYDNALAECSSLTASSSATDNPVDLLADWKPYTSWKPASGSSHTITAIWATERTITGWACWGHNLKTLSGSVLVEYWTGSAWATLIASYTPTTDDTIYQVAAASVSTLKIRWTFTASASLEICILCVGSELLPEVGLRSGWSPPHLAQKQTTLPSVSRSGQWLGVSVEQESADLTLTLEDVTEAWIRASWLPFKAACQTRPFFLRWCSTDVACLCTSAEFGACEYSQPGYHKAEVSFRAEL